MASHTRALLQNKPNEISASASRIMLRPVACRAFTVEYRGVLVASLGESYRAPNKRGEQRADE
jgi:hypothetical protein